MNDIKTVNKDTGSKTSLYVALLFIFISMAGLRYNTIENLFTSSQHDLRAYLGCAHNILNNRPIYTTHHQIIPEDLTLTRDVPKYTYPPLLGIVMIPATLLSYDSFKHIWFFLNLFFVFHGILLLALLMPVKRDTAITLFAVISSVAIGSDWILWLLRTAQSDAFTAYLVVLGLYFFEKNHLIASATLIAMAAWLKVTPGLVFLYMITRGNRKYFIYSVAAGLFFMLVQIAAVQGQFIDLFTKVLPERMSSPFPAPSMQSLWSLVHLLVDPISRRYKMFDAPQYADTMLLLLQIFIASIALLIFARRTKDIFTRFYGFAICAAASLLLTNSSWMMRYSWSYIFLSAVFTATVRSRHIFTVLPLGVIIIMLHLDFILHSFFERYTGAEQLLLWAPGFSAAASILFLSFIVVKDGGGWHPLINSLSRRVKAVLFKNSD